MKGDTYKIITKHFILTEKTRQNFVFCSIFKIFLKRFLHQFWTNFPLVLENCVEVEFCCQANLPQRCNEKASLKIAKISMFWSVLSQWKNFQSGKMFEAVRYVENEKTTEEWKLLLMIVFSALWRSWPTSHQLRTKIEKNCDLEIK